jgi:hypothetical protein
MFELLFLFGVLTLGVVVLVTILKLLVALLLLPFKLAWWMAKGLVGLLLIVPLALVGFLVFTNVFPVMVLLLLLPVIAVVAGVGLLVKLVFC